jgi:hypothetical protein
MATQVQGMVNTVLTDLHFEVGTPPAGERAMPGGPAYFAVTEGTLGYLKSLTGKNIKVASDGSVSIE